MNTIGNTRDKDDYDRNDDELLIIDYIDIVADPADCADLSSLLVKAFGSPSALGVIGIRNVPSFQDAKNALLPQAHTLAHLSSSYLEEHLTDSASLYNAGWSHGKEKLGDKPDTAKGSFYFNPLSDFPGTREDREKYPASYPCNKWPPTTDDNPLPHLELAAKRLGRIMHQVVVSLSKHLDAHAQACCARNGHTYPKNLLYDAMKDTEKVKGRLLYYFPTCSPEEQSMDKQQVLDDSTTESPLHDSWIGWHNDSGFLTALAGDIYVDHSSGDVIPDDLIDPTAGLYVMNRKGDIVKVDIPHDCMAVQIGECTQIVTGGAVIATPHCVKAVSSLLNMARISHPTFIDTKPTFPLNVPCGCTRQDVLLSGVGANGTNDGHVRVPPLEERWTENGMAFGDFLQNTFAKYYEWSSK